MVMAGPTGKTGNKIPSGYKHGQVQNFTPEMMDFYQQLIGMLGPESFLGKLAGGDESTFGEIEAPALRQFTGLQGNLASKFSGMGLGNRRSSGFGNAANAQAQDFASQLQSQRTEMRMNAIKEMLGMGNMLLQQRPYESFLSEKDDDKNKFLKALLKGGGGAIGAYFGGPAGAMAGYKIGSGVSEAF